MFSPLPESDIDAATAMMLLNSAPGHHVDPCKRIHKQPYIHLFFSVSPSPDIPPCHRLNLLFLCVCVCLNLLRVHQRCLISKTLVLVQERFEKHHMQLQTNLCRFFSVHIEGIVWHLGNTRFSSWLDYLSTKTGDGETAHLAQCKGEKLHPAVKPTKYHVVMLFV